VPEINNKIKSISPFKKIFKILSYLGLVFIILFAAALLLFYLYKDDISKKLLLSLNEVQNGEITVENISLTPFAQFPSISISLENTTYFENPLSDSGDVEMPICEFENIYIAFDLLELLNGNINLSKITIDGGKFNLVTYPDSSINLFNSLGLTKEYKKEGEIHDTSDESVQKKDINLAIDDLVINNVIIEFDNQVKKQNLSLDINYLDASFEHNTGKNQIKLNTDIQLLSFVSKDEILLSDKSIHLDTDLLYDGENHFIDVKPSSLNFEQAKFNISGSFDIDDDGNIDMNIKGSDEDFSFFPLILRKKAILNNIENLSKGDIYFNGVVKGKTFIENPFAEFSFGVKDVTLNISHINKSIIDLNFEGHFTTGRKQDYSEAELSLNNLKAQLPYGNTGGSISIQNFVSPNFDVDFKLRTEIGWFNKLFKIDFIENPIGIISIDSKLKGSINKVENVFLFDDELVDIKFEDVSFSLPDILVLNRINGTIREENKKLFLDSLVIITEKSDLLIDGVIENIVNLPVGIESNIKAELTLLSKIFVFPELFAFDTSAARDFPYTIYNLDLKTKAFSSTKNFLNFDDFPNIDFEINHLNGNFTELPDLQIRDSRLNIYEDLFGFNMKFAPLDIFVAQGELTLNGAYNGSEDNPYYFKSDIKTKDINMLDMLNQFELELDTISFFNTLLNGSLFLEMEFPKDSLIFKSFRISDANLELYHLIKKDTIKTKSLKVDLNNIYYNLDIDSNPMATLSTTGNIIAKQLSAQEFKVDNMIYEISVDRGQYKIIPNKNNFFGKEGEGIFILQPWSEVPNYSFKYSIEKFAIEDLLTSFLEDTVITGKMDFSMDLSMSGNNWDSLASQLNGVIYIEGDDLLMYGVDIDKLLKQFERSQNFTLIDVGAVLLTGPVGLAVTKGSDFALLAVGNLGEVTNIPHFVSNWKINNGILKMDDVAFNTKENRVAAQGSLNIVDKTLEITFAVLNEKGCSKLSQTISGSFEEPVAGEVNVLGALLGPVTNLWNSIVGNDCGVFYDGSVKHPE